MNWFYYLNYRIYKFYQRRKDSTPAIASFFACITLLFLNIFIILAMIDFLWPLSYFDSKYNALLLMFLLALLNYLLLYRKKKHVDIFHHFDRNRELYRKWDLSTTLYIVGTIVFMLVILIIADIRNHR
ncbi:hypothetical protein D7D25_14115 [Proteiniphilum sp. X52]|nr:hypothetical protein D7D25_14115 [Proteiniphilum sp. X52]